MHMQNVEKIEGYYHAFPPKSMNIAVEVSPQDQLKKILVATKDFKAGDVIYQEHPLVAALDPDIQAAKSHCSHCLRVVDSSTAIKVTADPLAVVYCSSACQSASKSQHHAILFTLEPVLPPQATEAAITPEMIETRRKVQLQFAEYLQKHEGNNLLLVARFVARQIVSELTQFIPSTSRVSVGDFTDADGKKYSLGDHLERLRYIDVPESQQSRQVFSPVLEAAIPSLSAYIVDDRFNQLLGKMAYNAFGVCFEGGRDDKPASMVAPEDAEHTRTPYSTSHQIGSALYTLSSYLTHSCVPSARPAFTKGTSELHLIAERDIKKGEELTVAFVQVSQRPGESTAECRRRRRYEIARGWKFACGCARCSDELVSAGPTDELADMKDESKTDHAPQAYEAAKSALASGDVE